MSDVPHYYADAAFLTERSLSYDYIILVAETPKVQYIIEKLQRALRI